MPSDSAAAFNVAGLHCLLGVAQLARKLLKLFELNGLLPQLVHLFLVLLLGQAAVLAGLFELLFPLFQVGELGQLLGHLGELLFQRLFLGRAQLAGSKLFLKLLELVNLEQRKKQVEEARKNGGLTEKQYQKEMDKLQEQSKQLKQLQQLASKLGDAQKAMQAGDMKKAAESLGMSEKQLSDMSKQLEELQSLDSALADVQDAKSGMQGDAMNQLGEDLNSLGLGNGMRKGQGQGLGRGRGQGDRPIAPDDTATYTSKVKQQLKKGRAVFQGLTTPTNTVKGEVVIDMQAEIDAVAGSNADPLSNQKIPKHLEKHVRAYYDQLNKGN